MESHSVPSRAEAFPFGLRVLVVDDDPTWLKILEKMLRKCSYEVTTCGLARVALEILRERKNKFDIVISDVNMPDMDGFKLLEHIGLEMDLPVIMMSIDGETSRVMKGVQHGACDYLLKPVRMKELRNIWQHVYRKKMHEVKEIEGHEFTCDDLQLIREAGFEGFEERGFLTREDKKRKEEHSDQDGSDQSAVKKARVVWSVDLHQKFVNAVNQIGFDKVGPKKILDLMNVPGLTRENVASHLQKYRLYLSRLQKQNEDSALGNNRRADFSPKEPPAKPDLTSPPPVQQGTTPNSSSGFGFVAPKTETQPIKPISHFEEDIKVKKKGTSMPPLGMLLSFTGTIPNAEIKPSEPLTTLKHQTWTSGLPVMQFMQYPKHDHERCNLLGDYSCLPKPDLYTSAPSVISINMQNGTGNLLDVKPALMDCIKAISPLTCTVDGSTLGLDGLPGIKGCFLEQTGSNAEPGHITGSDLVPLPEDLHLYSSFQEIACFENVGLMNSIDLFQTEVESSSNWCDGSELLDYPLIDECLFA
ncbi:hypothetical protein LUZ63_003458 [Rhynchospora breviuscula]|uniref:Response regulatory domain-containing protein n=1 Tax=Rhynchospora breviuscula TaxID=2022672 RepID=A0A9Q0HYR8_9POAL|nr:hypothetical protein LUZ63_003458 [Rhynchospora breviuscula]